MEMGGPIKMVYYYGEGEIMAAFDRDEMEPARTGCVRENERGCSNWLPT